ncbi:MAG: porin family protein [Acidobacteria bacterium]|nr:porin family protein [Acidobacteriota bacterium]
MRRMTQIALLGGLLLGTAAPASADGFFFPYVGGTFGGASDDGAVTAGASVGFMSAGVLGMEVDLAHTPNFLASVPDVTGEGSMTSLMVNLMLGVPVGGTSGIGLRPYVSGGAGLLRAAVDSPGELFDDIERNSLGVNIGAGLMGFFNDYVGLRGDVRYFRSLEDDEDEPFDTGLGDFDFTRATIGVMVRF